MQDKELEKEHEEFLRMFGLKLTALHTSVDILAHKLEEEPVNINFVNYVKSVLEENGFSDPEEVAGICLIALRSPCDSPLVVMEKSIARGPEMYPRDVDLLLKGYYNPSSVRKCVRLGEKAVVLSEHQGHYRVLLGTGDHPQPPLGKTLVEKFYGVGYKKVCEIK